MLRKFRDGLAYFIMSRETEEVINSALRYYDQMLAIQEEITKMESTMQESIKNGYLDINKTGVLQ
jgi:hypothetical protein